MKKILIMTMVVLCAGSLFLTSANATPINYIYEENKISEATIAGLLGVDAGDIFASKVDSGSGHVTISDEDADFDLMVSSTGYWEASVAVSAFTLKASTYSLVVVLDQPSLSGTWSLAPLYDSLGSFNPDLSHFEAYSTSAPVPEPATLLLLGTGLLGLASVSRKKLKKNK